MYVDPYQFICKTDTHTNKSCARNQIWTGDTRIFSPLLYQLSYPDHYPCIVLILIDNLSLCQLKRQKKSYKALSRPCNFLDLQKENFISFNTVQEMICIVNHSNWKWGYLPQRCSFVRVSYITNIVIRKKKKNFHNQIHL